MKPVLADFFRVRSRFSRAANIERDHGASAIDGYVPTGRALDIISRIAAGLMEPAAGRTFSITGPHGGGKSSLAVYLDGLFSASSSPEARDAHSILETIDPSVDANLRTGIRAIDAESPGFIRAFATARNESVAATVGRALHIGATRQFGPSQRLVPEGFGSGDDAPTLGEIRHCVTRMAKTQPVLLVIDEFGKNLEHFATSGAEGDPFLLQELAELTQGAKAAPLVIITMQHLSFDEYIQDSSTARRREWSKVQGRFQDIPYIETAGQSYRLVAAAFEQTPGLRDAADDWMSQHQSALKAEGLRDIAQEATAAIPLHPIALVVLPELCTRYGQNERTLFSFLTGSEPTALPQYLSNTHWEPGLPLPLAGADRLYDYFLEAWSGTVGVADGASRWVEIETRIRDSAGLTADQLKALKTIGLLNLASSGGRVRASRPLLELALQDESGRSSDVDEVLDRLVAAGLVTYRAFADEYRIWHGSDYNIRRVIENAQHGYENVPLADLLRDALSLDPLVAGRHSQRAGVLRAFGRQFSDGAQADLENVDPAWDGIVSYITKPMDPAHAASVPDGRPTVYAIPDDVSAVRAAAVEAAALNGALQSAENEGADWVARRELVERVAGAQQRLHTLISQAWDLRAEWFLAGSNKALDPRLGLSAVLSDVADEAYPRTPRVANEMIARRELTSQGAKARRFLIDALIVRNDSEAFAIEGYGPDRAIYEAIFRTTGLHQLTDSGEWALQAPTDRRWKYVWDLLNTAFDSAVESRVSLSAVSSRLTQPPVGLKDGIIPLLLIAGLVARSDDIALYEHGSLILSIDDAVAERLTKNIGHFSIKNTQTRGRKRAVVIQKLVERLGITRQ